MNFLVYLFFAFWGTNTIPQKPVSTTPEIVIYSIKVWPQAKRLPSPMPDKKASMQEWEQYSLTILNAMFPGEEQEIRRTSIQALPDSGRVSGVSSIFGSKIVLNIKLVRSVAFSPEEFAVLLGHEFAHFLIQREENPYGGLKGEIEADLMGVAPLKGGECHWAAVLERMLESPICKPLLDSDSISKNQSRIDRLKAICSR